MKMISWNVNGLRACLNKGFMDAFRELDADIFCLQETKMEMGQAQLDLAGYEEYWYSAVKRGYSGTAVFTRKRPVAVHYGMGLENYDQEGRVINLEFDGFYLVNVYAPNSQRELARLHYRMEWEDAFRSHLMRMDAKKPVIVCGDLNVAHEEIDLRHPKSNRKNAGFTNEEREKMTTLLQSGFADTFRSLYPDKTDAYTWWSYMRNARQNNAGWRIDYFIVSNRLMDKVENAEIYPQIIGSDHCPIGLFIKE